MDSSFPPPPLPPEVRPLLSPPLVVSPYLFHHLSTTFLLAIFLFEFSFSFGKKGFDLMTWICIWWWLVGKVLLLLI